MIAIVCLLFPALVLCEVRNRLCQTDGQSENKSLHRYLVELLCASVIINGSIVVAHRLLRSELVDIVGRLNIYSDFAMKYLVAGIVLALLIPYMEWFCKKKIQVDCRIEKNKITVSEKAKIRFVYVFALFMASHHFIRLFNNCFWGDEGIVIVASRLDWNEMLRYVAGNGHSPFHYVFAWICRNFWGESGFLWHFSATLPYFLLILVAATMIRRWFGNHVSILFMVLSTLLESAVIYNLEVRMYAWCQLFILMAFLMSYKLFVTEKKRYYFLMSVFSIGAVYSHYFALASIGILYIFLFLYKVKRNFKEVYKVILSGISILVCLLPWLVYCKKIKGVVMSNYLIKLVAWDTCFDYIFKSPYSGKLLACFFAALLIRLVYDLKIVVPEKISEGKIRIRFSISRETLCINGELVWVLAGVCGAFGTIIASQIISEFVYPITIVRYLYPAFVIAWLLLAVNASRCKLGKIYIWILVGVLCWSGYPGYINTVKKECEENMRLEETLDVTVSQMDENDFIYTDIKHFSWTVKAAYYPNTPGELFGHPEWWGVDEIPALDPEVDYWLFLESTVTEDVIENLLNQGYTLELVVDNGFIGTGNVWIYKVVPLNKGE